MAILKSEQPAPPLPLPTAGVTEEGSKARMEVAADEVQLASRFFSFFLSFSLSFFLSFFLPPLLRLFLLFSPLFRFSRASMWADGIYIGVAGLQAGTCRQQRITAAG